MGRLLKSRLALASFKAKNGWEHLPLKTVEPLAERKLKRKRPRSSGETVSDSSSTISDHHHLSGMNFSTSSTGHMLAGGMYRHGSGHNYKKRAINKSNPQHPDPSRGVRRRANSISSALSKPQTSLAVWNNLPQSSPVHHRQYSQLPVSHGANLSFVSETSTVPTEAFSPNFAAVSDDEEHDLQIHSFQASSSQICSSPPRTPPPSRSRPGRLREANKSTSANHDPQTGKEGADLLLYLAGSPPSSVNPGKTRIFAPATPPSRHLALPSSMMTTPTGLLSGFGGPSTPSQFFDFADFVNITPSPGQQQWGNRTPHILRTPLAAKDARRKLNFDALVPPSGSPNLGGTGGDGGKKRLSLGSQMQLGGELVP
jgi:Whi5 like